MTRIPWPWAHPWLRIAATLLLVLISPCPTLLVLVAMLICASLALALVTATLWLSVVPKVWCSSSLFVLACGWRWFHGVFPFDRGCWAHDWFGKHYLVHDKVQERSRAILPSDAWNEILAELTLLKKKCPSHPIAQMMRRHTFTLNAPWIVCVLLLLNICFTSVSFE